jgi:4-hydroxybenzoate polyprenyltransferase
MGARLLAALRLVRLPNTLTAAADVAAGAAIVGVDPLSAPALLAAAGSAAIYGGGVALNDICDLEKDRELHPDRVLVRGELGTPLALALASALLAAGASTSFAGGAAHLATTGALLALVVGYDLLPGRFRLLGAALMGGCRAANLMRGMTLAAAAPDLTLLVPAGGHWLLIFLVTVVSLFEDPARPRRGLRTAAALLVLPYLIPGTLTLPGIAAAGALGAGLALGIYVSEPAFRTPPRPHDTVMRAIFTLVIFDALYAAGAGYWLAAALLALLLVIIRRLAATLRQRGA